MSQARSGVSAEGGRAVPAGLCGRCAQGRRVVSDRGSTFLKCGRAAADPAFARYPRLPVLRCPGFEAAGGGRRSSGADATHGPGRTG